MSNIATTEFTAKAGEVSVHASMANASGFELLQRISKAFADSDLVPATFKGKMANCVIAVELAQRIGASPLMVMQNLHVIHGRPSFSSSFLIASINSCGLFSALRFKVTGEGDQKSCVAWATDKHGEVLEGPPASIAMAKEEGWFGRTGSKWKTMPDLMLRYRAAAFFQRLYCPEITMGMQTAEEAADAADAAKDVTPPESEATAAINAQIEAASAKKRTARKAAAEKPPVIEGEVINDGQGTKPPASDPAGETTAELASVPAFLKPKAEATAASITETEFF